MEDRKVVAERKTWSNGKHTHTHTHKKFEKKIFLLLVCMIYFHFFTLVALISLLTSSFFIS